MEVDLEDSISLALRLPETLGNVFRYLSVADRGRAAQVSRDWQEACRQPSLWKDAECTLVNSGHIKWDILQKRQISKFKVVEEDASYFWLFDLITHIKKIRSLDFSACVNLNDVIVQSAFHLHMPEMTRLSLQRCHKLTDASVDVVLSRMPNLESLDLGLCFFLTDASLHSVATRLPRIRELDLSLCSRMTDEGVGYLTTTGRPSKIEKLGLSGCHWLTEAAVHHLYAMAQLSDLDISFCIHIGDNGMDVLYAMGSLQALDVSGCDGITALCVERLSRMSGLRKLALANCSHFSIAGLSHKGGVQSGITHLNVAGCSQLGSEALAVIATRLRQLQLLVLDASHISDRGVALASRFLRQLREMDVVPMYG